MVFACLKIAWRTASSASVPLAGGAAMVAVAGVIVAGATATGGFVSVTAEASCARTATG